MLPKFDASVPCPNCGKLIHPKAVACRHCDASLGSPSVRAETLQTGASGGTVLLSVFAMLIAFGSWLFVSQATSGVAGICFACLVGIIARIVQAHHHQRMLLQRLAREVQP